MKVHYAILSGLFAATAGIFGKVSGSKSLEELLLLRIICFGGMLACNAIVWMMFVKALHQSESSLVATIISSTTNYALTAFLGYFLLGELTTTYWWLGMFFIIIGLSIIISEDIVQNKSFNLQRKKL